MLFCFSENSMQVAHTTTAPEGHPRVCAGYSVRVYKYVCWVCPRRIKIQLYLIQTGWAVLGQNIDPLVRGKVNGIK